MFGLVKLPSQTITGMQGNGRIFPEALSLSSSTYELEHEATTTKQEGGRLSDIYGELSVRLTSTNALPYH